MRVQSARCLIALSLISVVSSGARAEEAARVDEVELVAGVLARHVATGHGDALASAREAAHLARVSAPSWRVEALREESTSQSTAFTTEVLSVGVGVELGRRNATERRRALAELSAWELAHRAELVDAVSNVRLLAAGAWEAEREVGVLGEWQEHVDELERELERLVEAGERSRFDLERLRSAANGHRARLQLASAAARAATTRLEALGGIPVEAVALADLPELSPGDDLVTRALSEHPVLAGLRRRQDAGDLSVALARTSQPGALDLRAGYRRDDGPGIPGGDGYEVEASYTLPSRSMRRLAEARARARRSERSLDLARAELRVASEVTAAFERCAALDEAVPSESDGADALRRGCVRRYRAGESTMDELIGVLTELEEQSLQAIDAAAARRRARLELDRATGLMTSPEFARLVTEIME